MPLKYTGTTYAIIDGCPTLVAIDATTGYLTVHKVNRLADSAVGTRHRRLALAAQRALDADAALRWRLHRGGFRVRLHLDASGGGLLAARLCLPYLMHPKPLPLYRFQRTGVARLLRSSRVLFADDMGLGKTVQAAVALRTLVASGRVRNALVVAPATLVPNWLSELSTWVPELVVSKGTPARHSHARSWSSLMSQCHVVVTNYEDIRGAASIVELPRIDLLILDEAHRVKNWDSLTSKVVRQIDCNRIWALTGTPLERDSKDFTSLLALLDPNAFTSGDAKLSSAIVRARAARFILRREKQEVLAELPPVVRRHERLLMGANQRSTYRRVATASSTKLNSLTVFSRLRGTCDYDPKTGESVKIDRIAEILGAVRQTGEKAIEPISKMF